MNSEFPSGPLLNWRYAEALPRWGCWACWGHSGKSGRGLWDHLCWLLLLQWLGVWVGPFLRPEGACWNEGRHLDFHISWAWAQISVWKIQLDPVSHAGLETFLPGLDEKLKWLVKNPVVYIEFTCNEGICLHMLSCKCRYMQWYNIEEKH